MKQEYGYFPTLVIHCVWCLMVADELLTIVKRMGYDLTAVLMTNQLVGSK